VTGQAWSGAAAHRAGCWSKIPADLEPRLARARKGLVASFVSGVLKDRAAVSAAISAAWSNGQTKGQITKLKLLQPQMCGRGKLDLPQARLIDSA
jgi:transposase